MKVTSARFVISAMRPEDYPAGPWPEIAFVGRSNVGKSTLLNTLLNRKGLAKTSATPGKTQTINFFAVNEKFHFVDLPGYGYAKVPKAMKQQWNRVMVDYLRERETLRMVAALVDARHKPSDKDLQMLDILAEAEAPTLIVATKIDKVKKSQRKKNIQRIQDTLETGGDAVLPFSAVTGQGFRELWQVIDEQVGG